MIRVSSAVQRHAQKLIVLFSLLFGASLLMSDNGFATDIKNTNASSPVNSESTKPTKAGEVKMWFALPKRDRLITTPLFA